MKKLVLSMALIVALGMSFTSCRDTKENPDVIILKAEEKTEKAAEEAAKETEGALEKAGKAVDNAAEETKEAGKAIEDAAKEIGDDN